MDRLEMTRETRRLDSALRENLRKRKAASAERSDNDPDRQMKMRKVAINRKTRPKISKPGNLEN